MYPTLSFREIKSIKSNNNKKSISKTKQLNSKKDETESNETSDKNDENTATNTTSDATAVEQLDLTSTPNKLIIDLQDKSEVNEDTDVPATKISSEISPK
jgi:hypothetical protein